MRLSAQFNAKTMTLLIVCRLAFACAGRASYNDCPSGAGGNAADASASTGGNSTGSATVIDCAAVEGIARDDTCPNIYATMGSCFVKAIPGFPIRPPDVLLVLDRSSSMNELNPSGDGRSKWESTLSALAATLSELQGASVDGVAKVALGLQLFPFDRTQPISDQADPATACAVPSGGEAIAVPITPGRANLRAIFDLLSAQRPGGYTPTAVALRQALEYFSNGQGRCLNGSRLVMLVTHGAGNCNPSLTCSADSCTEKPGIACSSSVSCCNEQGLLCADDEAVIGAIGQLALVGVETLVVAAEPESNLDRNALNAYARAGHLENVANSSGDAFYSIADGSAVTDLLAFFGKFPFTPMTSCDIELSDFPPQRTGLEVFADCQEIYQAATDKSAGGWLMDDTQSPPHLKLIGSTCTSVQRYGIYRLDVFACPVVIE